MSEHTDTPDIDDEVITCWCGAKGTYDELFSDDLDDTCGGMGIVNCYCGGDLCVCHHHGETECPGCDDCQYQDDDDFGATFHFYDDDEQEGAGDE